MDSAALYMEKRVQLAFEKVALFSRLELLDGRQLVRYKLVRGDNTMDDNAARAKHSGLLSSSLLRGISLLFILCTADGQPLCAQTSPLPAKFKPPQLATARTVFLSNDTAGTLTDSDRIYDEFQTGIQQLHRFTIVSDPADADLILEFGIQHEPAAYASSILLRVLDGKSHTAIWSVGAGGGIMAVAEVKKNHPDAIDQIVDYLQAITASGQPGTN